MDAQCPTEPHLFPDLILFFLTFGRVVENGIPNFGEGANLEWVIFLGTKLAQGNDLLGPRN